MSDNDSNLTGDPVPSTGESDTAESKRRAARRSFLKGSAAAAGAGAIVVTFYHQRAAAGGKKIMVSSAAVCSSLHGTPGKQTQVKDVTNPNGPKVTVTECELPK